MEQLLPNEQPIRSTEQVSEVVLAALLTVYDSGGELEAEDIVMRVADQTGFNTSHVAGVVNKLYDPDPKYAYLLNSSDPNYKTMFGANGLWLVETTMMQDSGAELDPVAVATSILVRNQFVSESAWERHSAGMGQYPHHLAQ